MGIEIERKFLVINDAYKESSTAVLYRQGYISNDFQRVVRVRVAGKKGFLTIKSQVSDISRLEFEYEIPLADAMEMLEHLCLKPLIEKYRYQLNIDGNIWVVDEFLGDNKGLVVAEIELDSEQQSFSRPAWIGEEVTGDSKYLNASLVSYPYKRWKRKDQLR
ncbi:MAG: CYTH domain-containing protein [Candidatus Marinimicrobia bacterium]|nr:CYTH domain-containing protein [Candidatus Neomarinimicrobiota bacterium]